MKLEKLFKKLETFFKKPKKKQKEKRAKRIQLQELVNEKINSKKEKIKVCENKEKKAKLKEELRMLSLLQKRYKL